MARSRYAQRGAALLVMAAILVVGGSWWLLSSANAKFNSHTADSRKHNARVLSLAKQALIGYVAHRVNYPANPLAAREAHPGRLPCPEADGFIGTPNEGVAASVCILPAVGRLPWKTLGLDQLRDASGEPLWYVVSEGWTLHSTVPSQKPSLNSNTRGQLTVDGQPNASAALLIAPSAAVSVQASANCAAYQQTRSTPAPGINLRNYLECQNSTSPADASFATAGPSGSFNDQVLAVSAADIWSIVEGAVASRLVRDVIPALQSAFSAPYRSAEWGGSVSLTTPMLPFALPMADGSTQPYQGALPLWRSQGCTAGTDPLCDPEFVYWETTNPNPTLNPRVVKQGGDAGLTSWDCAIPGSPSIESEVICRISYGGSCGGGLGSILGGSCSLDLQVSVLASAQNVGHALRTFAQTGIGIDNDGGAPWFWSPWTPISPPSPTPIGITGAASADIRGNLPPASCNLIIILALLFPCNASETVAIRIPITVFQDSPELTALFAPDTDWEWFIENRWYEAMYYAVAPRHAPDGSPHDCRTAVCLTANGGSLPANARALVGMTGYSMSNLARPNTNLSDYLDSIENRNGDPAFEQKTAGRSFNDRFFSVSAY